MSFHIVVRRQSFVVAIRLVCALSVFVSPAPSLAHDAAAWKYTPEALTPFWETDVVDRESVLFIRNPQTGVARASLLFPIKDVISVRDASGQMSYTEGVDFRYKPGTNLIEVPTGSRIVTKAASDLRVPVGSHRVGDHACKIP
jgi:acyl-CoA thioesterase-1